MKENWPLKPPDKLAEAVSQWEMLFENKPGPILCFSETAEGLLTLNGIVLGPVTQFLPDNAIYDVEMFSLPMKNGGFMKIGIDWSYGSVPRISYIMRCSYLYYSN